MTADPFEGMSREQIRGFLTDVSDYTGKPVTDCSWDDFENYLARTRAAVDQDAARSAHLAEINTIMDRHADLAAITPTMGALLDVMPADDAARLCRLQELTGLLDGGAR